MCHQVRLEILFPSHDSGFVIGSEVFYKPARRTVTITKLEYDEKNRFTKVYFDDTNYLDGNDTNWSFPNNFIKIS